MSEGMDPASVLEEAADLLLVNGRCRDKAFGPGESMCVMAAISKAMPGGPGFVRQTPAWLALKDALDESPVKWNREIEDDFEVIDTLRHLAKDIRNSAVQP